MPNPPPLQNNTPAAPRLGPQPDPVQLPDNFQLPPVADDVSTTASGLSSLQTSPGSSPATSPRDTDQRNGQIIQEGRQ